MTRGLVTRTPDAADRRRWRLNLTEEGTKQLEEGRRTLRAAVESVVEPLSVDERTALIQGLNAVQRVLGTK